MGPRARCWGAAALAFAISAIANAQAPPTFRSGTASVLVDVVVRDKQGVPVQGLTADAFDLAEEGVSQSIDRIYAIHPIDAAPVPAVVALAFDPLSSEALAIATHGVDAYLSSTTTSDFTGVFQLGTSLSVELPFTSDAEAVRAAVRRLSAKTSGAGHSASAPQGKSGDGAAGTTTTGWQIAFITQTFVDNVLVDHKEDISWGVDQTSTDETTIRKRLARAEADVNEQMGASRLTGLLVLIDALGALPGRKCVVYFSEADSMANDRARDIRADIVAAANRNNVAIYTVDAGGLRVDTASKDLSEHLAEQTHFAVGDMERDTARPWTTDLEKNEQLVQGDARTSLRTLAEWTGGFMVADTNSFKRALDAIEADRRWYYLLRYTPKNTNFQGEYRRIRVKVPGRDAVVRARSGYLAVAATGPGLVFTNEAPAIAALGRSPLPTAIPVRGSALSLPSISAPGRLATLVAVDANSVTFATTGDTYRSDFTVLGLIRNGAGQAVEKVSRRYRLTGPASRMAEAQRGQILFYDQKDLPEGVYSFDYVVYDALSGKAGGRHSDAFVIPGREDTALLVGSLVVVHHTERLAKNDARMSSSPLAIGDVLVYPSMGEPISRASGKALSFYVPVVDTTQSGPTASLELLRDGQVVGLTQVDVPPPDAGGRRAVAGQLPLDSLPSGSYSLRLTLRQGSQSATREAAFSIVD